MLVAQTVKNLPTLQKTWVWSLGPEDPLEKVMQPTPVFLPGEFYGQRSLEVQSMGLQRVGHNWTPNRHTHVNAQRCVSSGVQQSEAAIPIHTPSFPGSSLIQVITECPVESLVRYSVLLLVYLFYV